MRKPRLERLDNLPNAHGSGDLAFSVFFVLFFSFWNIKSCQTGQELPPRGFKTKQIDEYKGEKMLKGLRQLKKMSLNILQV